MEPQRSPRMQNYKIQIIQRIMTKGKKKPFVDPVEGSKGADE